MAIHLHNCAPPTQIGEIRLSVSGDVQGTWDPHRLHQLLGNLVLNAFKHGARHAPVQITLVGRSTEVELSVVNPGPSVEESVVTHIFAPLVRGNARIMPQTGTLASGSVCT